LNSSDPYTERKIPAPITSAPHTKSVQSMSTPFGSRPEQ
jgi:hypothetical protein